MNVDFGPKHLTGLAWLLSLIAVVLTVLLVIKKKGKLGGNFDRAVIRYTAYFMWAMEIVKTVRMINYDDMNFGPVGHYPLWMAPFHICSMALYAYPIIGAKQRSKLANWVDPFAYSVLMLMSCLIMTIPASSGILGHVENWSFCVDNILPYQSWLYHGCLLFVPLYMALSGFYRPKWLDIFKGLAVLGVTAAFSQGLNYLFEGSGADYMTLRYGNGNPFAPLLKQNPMTYYLVLAGIALVGITLIISVTIGIRALAARSKVKVHN